MRERKVQHDYYANIFLSSLCFVFNRVLKYLCNIYSLIENDKF